MSSTYSQLTQEERYQIYEMKVEGKKPSEIAAALGRDRSTIYREYNRNTGKRGYRPHQAHEKAMERRLVPRHPIYFTAELQLRIQEKIKEHWSPEQICGRFALEGAFCVSHERIYQFIKADKNNGGTLYTYLRRSNRKRKKRFGKPSRQGQIPGRVSIDERPAVVNEKGRLGDWEGDTVVGRNHRGGLTTAAEVNGVIEMKFQGGRLPFHTLTYDNGCEMSRHAALTKKFGIRVYFAHPYSSWERGLNENTNGLIRQFFPKKTDFSTITDAEVERVQNLLNHRPRKTLGYLTPHEVLVERKPVVVQRQSVALVT
jgi:IS30 family transposase